MFSFPADNIHPEENPCFCSIIENYDVNTKLMFFWHFIPFSDIIIMVYNCFLRSNKKSWNNKIIFVYECRPETFLGFWVHLQMPRSPGNHVAFFYVFNYVCTSKNLAMAFWKEGAEERDIWQKAFTFVLSFSKEIFPCKPLLALLSNRKTCIVVLQCSF